MPLYPLNYPKSAIWHYLAEHNLQPKRYVWRADGQRVLEKIRRAWEAALA
jgi:hypothetical protein